MTDLELLVQQLTRTPAVLVQVQATRGSVPREAGTWMAVSADATIGTIGGGHLEFDATAHARALLAGQAQEWQRRYALGPHLGQCCGGDVQLQFELLPRLGSAMSNEPAAQALIQRLRPPATPVALFGGGHVGRALVRVLCSLPMQITWVDSRDEIFPAELPAQVQCEHSDPVQRAVEDLSPGSRVLIMSFSHAEDLDIVAACLQRQRQRADLPYVGLIGSRTKWASFRQRLLARGFTEAELSHVTCRIGVPGIHDKRPEVIAVAVAAQLLQQG